MLTLHWNVAAITSDPDGPCVAVDVWSEEEHYRVYRDVPVLSLTVYRYKTWGSDAEVRWLVKGNGLDASYMETGAFPSARVCQALDLTHSPLEAELVSGSIAEAFSLLLARHPEAFRMEDHGNWEVELDRSDLLKPTASLALDFGVFAA